MCQLNSRRSLLAPEKSISSLQIRSSTFYSSCSSFSFSPPSFTVITTSLSSSASSSNNAPEDDLDELDTSLFASSSSNPALQLGEKPVKGKQLKLLEEEKMMLDLQWQSEVEIEQEGLELKPRHYEICVLLPTESDGPAASVIGKVKVR